VVKSKPESGKDGRVVEGVEAEVGRALSLLWNQREYEGDTTLLPTGDKQGFQVGKQTKSEEKL
jgi:hypothetical protein